MIIQYDNVSILHLCLSLNKTFTDTFFALFLFYDFAQTFIDWQVSREGGGRGQSEVYINISSIVLSLMIPS